MQAQTEVNIREIRDSQKLGVLERAGKIITNIKEDQYARHKQTQSANLAAYQTEAAEHVGVTGAKGLGKMGASGVGNMNGGGGFNPAAMMAGMAMGSTIGRNLAGNMDNMMGNINRQGGGQPFTPQPIPTVVYHVAVNGQAAGPYTIQALSQMVINGTLTRDSLIWTAGMSQWKKAGEIAELIGLFSQTPPPVPKS